MGFYVFPSSNCNNVVPRKTTAWHRVVVLVIYLGGAIDLSRDMRIVMYDVRSAHLGMGRSHKRDF